MGYSKELESLVFEEKEPLEVFMLILENLVDEAEELVFKDKLCCLNAIITTYTKYDQLMAESSSELINPRRSDLRSLVSYLVTYPKGGESTGSIHAEDAVIYAEELSPIELMKLKKQLFKSYNYKAWWNYIAHRYSSKNLWYTIHDNTKPPMQDHTGKIYIIH